MPTIEDVQVYSVYRNGLVRTKDGGLALGKGNRVTYATTMSLLGTPTEKVRRAKALAEQESGREVYKKTTYGKKDGKKYVAQRKGVQTADAYMAEFYRKEFDKLLDGARVANRQIEKYWEV